MKFGIVYYPEHWDESMWEDDARLIQEANCDFVRMGEFAWVKMEPSEGTYDFSWLDRACDILFRRGIKTILCTPTATPPKWLMDAYPDIYMEDEYGHKRGFGSRRHYCYNINVYRTYTEKIVEAMAKYFKNKPYVAAWQADNEYGCGDGGVCYCENCRNAFIAWLQKKYVNLENLNEHWGTIFWGQTYTEWDQIIVPKITVAKSAGESIHNPSLLIDYYRFSSDAIAEYHAFQYKILKKYYPNIPITHNIVSGNYDTYSLRDCLDVAAFDNHVFLPWGKPRMSDVSFNHSVTRGILEKNYWILEHQASQGGWGYYGDTMKPGQMRMLSYQSVAHGCEAIIYWRLRSCRSGTEQFWIGVIDHDNIPRRRYQELQQVTKELQKISKHADGSELLANILIVSSYDQDICHRVQPGNKAFNYTKLLKDYYAAFYKFNYNVDVAGEHADFNKYRLVVIPAYAIMNDEMRMKLGAYVYDGGHAILTFRSGYKEMDNRMSAMTIPGIFRDIVGAELWESDSLCFGRKVRISGIVDGTASMWCDIMHTTTAKILAHYAEEFYKDEAAITVNRFGKGMCYYIGCDLDEEALGILLNKTSSTAGVTPALGNVPEGVEALRKRTDIEELLFLTNFNSHEEKVVLDGCYQNMLDDSKQTNSITLPPYDAIGLYRTIMLPDTNNK